MRTIWKFPLQVTDEQVLELPSGAELLSVQTQNGAPCLWALVDPAMPRRPVVLATYGTGHPIGGPAGDFVGTYQLDGGNLVFHVFRRSGGAN